MYASRHTSRPFVRRRIFSPVHVHARMSTTPIASSSRRRVSFRRTTAVVGYTPLRGSAGTKLRVLFEYCPGPRPSWLRFRVGAHLVRFNVNRVGAESSFTFHLDTLIPFMPDAPCGRAVPLAIEVVDANGMIFDGIAFAYWVYEQRCCARVASLSR